MNETKEPALVIEYIDPEEGFRGWLVIDSLEHSLAAGGMRVCRGLSREHLCAMARNMTRKMRIADLGVDGAKSGIDYDPAAPGKLAAMTRFLRAIAPLVRERYSMGPDLNVCMEELQDAATAAGINSVKMAVARAMGWEPDYFAARYRILQEDVGCGKTLGQVRAGYGVAGAALASLERADIGTRGARIAVQGAGTLAQGLLHALKDSGVKVIAIADAEKTLTDKEGIDIGWLLSHPPGILPAPYDKRIKILPRDAVLTQECDLLLPLAVEGVITSANAAGIKARAVVPGANLAVTPDGHEALLNRGILTVPDFLAGAGGSISMEGLFRPARHPAAGDVLNHTLNRARELALEVFDAAEQQQTTPLEAALSICANRKRKKSGY